MGVLAFETKINIDDATRLYTSGDTISGILMVKVRRDASLQAIEVGVRCLVDAHVQIDKTHFHEKDRMYTQNIRVFPDKDIEDSMSEFTIHAGEYEYPFQLTLPDNPLLPQTLDKKNCMSGVYWYVKARVIHTSAVPNKMSWMMPSALSFSGTSFWGMAKQKFTFAPSVALPDPKVVAIFDSSRTLKAPKEDAPSGFMARFQSKNKLQVVANFQLTLPEKGLAQAPSPLHVGLRVQTSEANALEIAEIKVRLRSHTRVYVHHRMLCNSRFPTTHDLFTLHPHHVLDSKETDLSKYFSSKSIEKELPGSLDVPNIYHWYELKLDITLTSPHHPNFRKTVSVNRIVDIAPLQSQLPSYNNSETPDAVISATSGGAASTPPPADHGYTPMDHSFDNSSEAPPSVDFDSASNFEAPVPYTMEARKGVSQTS